MFVLAHIGGSGRIDVERRARGRRYYLLQCARTSFTFEQSLVHRANPQRALAVLKKASDVLFGEAVDIGGVQIVKNSILFVIDNQTVVAAKEIIAVAIVEKTITAFCGSLAAEGSAGDFAEGLAIDVHLINSVLFFRQHPKTIGGILVAVAYFVVAEKYSEHRSERCRRGVVFVQTLIRGKIVGVVVTIYKKIVSLIALRIDHAHRTVPRHKRKSVVIYIEMRDAFFGSHPDIAIQIPLDVGNGIANGGIEGALVFGRRHLHKRESVVTLQARLSAYPDIAKRIYVDTGDDLVAHTVLLVHGMKHHITLRPCARCCQRRKHYQTNCQYFGLMMCHYTLTSKVQMYTI